ncbi:hypothetical protein [Phyllobacterium endophyticum]|uniref:hypothetical protein n=1 Tax=Phyllobacterium endophyticum TaxID=1149773 RepID=UPI0011C882B8|nr:hypothetical protein [Phyllobacterium endophyticum]TXR50404.1 hypothetical protein FVA77_03665 [Phyllobacterium endophyticum]
MIAFSGSYGVEVFLLFLLERYIPYERRRLLPDGDTTSDIAHTILTTGLVQVIAQIAAVFPMLAASVLKPLANLKLETLADIMADVFPVKMALVLAEFGKI